MSLPAQIAAMLARVPAPVVSLVADVVRAIVGAPNPETAARRAHEAARARARDEVARRAKPRRP